MAIPIDRNSFIDYCLRRLGFPVLEINVDQDQLEDRVDDALIRFQLEHREGTMRMFIPYQLTAADIAAEEVPIDPSVLYMVRVLKVDELLSFGARSIAAMSGGIGASISLTHVHSMLPVWGGFDGVSVGAMTQFTRTMNDIFSAETPIMFRRHRNALKLNVNWNTFHEGEFIIMEVYSALDPSTYTDVWNDHWLKAYTTALFKFQWGSNLSKFQGITMPGGVTFNGDKLMDDAKVEIEKLEKELIDKYDDFMQLFVG